MKEIYPISLERINSGAHFLYLSNVLHRAEANTTISEKAKAQIDALKAALQQEEASLKISQKSLLTDEIARADDERDALLSGYKKAVAGHLNLPAETMKQAARVLKQHLTDYGIHAKMQLDRETGMMINFVSDLETKYAAEVDTLSLTPFVTHLKEANDRLQALTGQRTHERMKIPARALKKARKTSDEAYRMLVKVVNARALIEDEAPYAEFIDYVNTEITHYKREVIRPRSRKQETSAGNDADDAPTIETGACPE